MTKPFYQRISDDKETPGKPPGWLSIITFSWIGGLLKTGAQRPLGESDFLPLPDEHRTEALTKAIQEKWTQEKRECATPRLWRSALKAMPLRQFAVLVFTGLLDSTCRVLQPVFLGFLVSGIAYHQEGGTLPLYLCSVAMFLVAIAKSLSMHQFSYRSLILGMQLQAALKGVVYSKVNFTGLL